MGFPSMHIMTKTRLALFLTFAFLAPTARADEPNCLSLDELAEGWISLFDGETLFGWQPATEANWTVADGAIVVDSGEKGLLNTTSEFADYVLKVDFRAAAGTNSGVFLRTPTVPTDPKSDCYELNIADESASPFPTGSFVGRQRAEGLHPNGAWQSFEVTCQGAECTVRLDGQTVLSYVDPAPLGRGRIGLQFNSGRVEFRNVKLRPLSLESIFNGKDLTGWTVYPDRQSEFSVTPQGELNVRNGPGSLESEGQYADFTLQLEVFSNGERLNSGVFFRAIPGGFNKGYECQIQNGYADGDRAKPVDCGTGGFYRRQNARRVVSDDFTWFQITLVVSGDHMAAWVNGYPVSDWTDPRAPHENPREGLRREAGALAIQGHDPTTDLSFRGLRIAEMRAISPP